MTSHSSLTVCYYDHFGDPIYANAGSSCSFNTRLGLFAACRTSTPCSLAGLCYDTEFCSTGCGPFAESTYPPTTTISGIASLTCVGVKGFCDSYIVEAPDQTYTSLFCDQQPITATYLKNSPTGPSRPASSPSRPRHPSGLTVTGSLTSSAHRITTPPTRTPASSAGSTTVTSPSFSGATSPVAQLDGATPSIVGGTIGGAALVCLIVFGVLFLRRRRGHVAGGGDGGGSQEANGSLGAWHDQSGYHGQHQLYDPPVSEIDGKINTPEMDARGNPMEMDGQRNAHQELDASKSPVELQTAISTSQPGYAHELG